MRLRVKLLRSIAKLLVILSVLLLVMSSGARTHKHWGQGFSVDLNSPYDQVIKIVRQVTQDGVIRGTWQYRGSKELDGAKPAETSRAFRGWSGQGTVLYKVRPDTLAPEHFFESADQGTVVVRYVVEPVSPNVTRLQIDATFDEDDHHRSHPSDGDVENAEFAAISEQLKGAGHDQQPTAAPDAKQPGDGTQKPAGVLNTKVKELGNLEQQNPSTASPQQQREEQRTNLQSELHKENAQLQATTERGQKLQKEIEDLQRQRSARIKSAKADLKAEPYNQSKTLQSLSHGDTVLVLLQTPGWYRVQTVKGDQGWVYRLMLEAGP